MLASRVLLFSERPRRFLSDSEGPPFVPPALWLCPMRVGWPFRGVPESGSLESLTAEPRYAKYLDWVNSPPNVPAISLNGADQRCAAPITTAIGNRVVLSGAQELNAGCSMRMYIDDADKSNAIVKISPHVSANSLCPLPLPRCCPPHPISSSFSSSLKSSAKAPTKLNEVIPRYYATPSTRLRAAWASPTTCGFLRIILKKHLWSACSHRTSRVVTFWARAPFAAIYYSTKSGRPHSLSMPCF